MLGGTGQGNVLSEVACRDVSCLMFRRLEKKKLYTIIRSGYNWEIE